MVERIRDSVGDGRNQRLTGMAVDPRRETLARAEARIERLEDDLVPRERCALGPDEVAALVVETTSDELEASARVDLHPCAGAEAVLNTLVGLRRVLVRRLSFHASERSRSSTPNSMAAKPPPAERAATAAATGHEERMLAPGAGRVGDAAAGGRTSGRAGSWKPSRHPAFALGQVTARGAIPP
jgi:hypothetical protein